MKIGTLVRTGALLAAVAGGMTTAGNTGYMSARFIAPALAAPHRCWNFQLTIRPFKSSAGAGHAGTMYRIHNILPGACTLYGYPGALLMDRNFNTLPTHVTRGLAFLAGKHAPVTVTLQGNHDGYFVVTWVHFPTPGQSCPTAKHVLFIAPNDNLPVVTYAGNGDGEGGIMACGGNLTVSPVAPDAFPF
jgi:hypothetical protein